MKNHLSLLYAHYNDVIMGTMASLITGLTIVYSTDYLRCRLKKHQSSASLAFMRGIHRWPVNSPHKGLVTRKMFPLGDAIMEDWSWLSWIPKYDTRWFIPNSGSLYTHGIWCSRDWQRRVKCVTFVMKYCWKPVLRGTIHSALFGSDFK